MVAAVRKGGIDTWTAFEELLLQKLRVTEFKVALEKAERALPDDLKPHKVALEKLLKWRLHDIFSRFNKPTQDALVQYREAWVDCTNEEELFNLATSLELQDVIRYSTSTTGSQAESSRTNNRKKDDRSGSHTGTQRENQRTVAVATSTKKIDPVTGRAINYKTGLPYTEEQDRAWKEKNARIAAEKAAHGAATGVNTTPASKAPNGQGQ
ncbi:hypothetical protein LTR85_010383 [Meristemomyces frigidus]|nr:hypothetical protein LTR85_010383 [Meristemomyces frigidus]